MPAKTCSTLHIAILICDCPPPDVVAEIGTYDTAFHNMLTRAARAYSETSSTRTVSIKTTPFDCVNGPLPTTPSAFDAFIMTGSKSSAYDKDAWILNLIAFVATTVQNHKPKWIGVCFGQQILAQALGGKVEKNPAGWEAGWVDARLTEEGNRILNTRKSQFALQYSHQDHVSILPPRFAILASNSVCPIEAMARDDKILAVQGHPEFTPNVLRATLKYRHALGIFTNEFYDNALKAIDKPLDASWLVVKFVGFMLGDIIND
ncbi:hypothetical protein SeMB42_g01101 [Synchytrium endobioticum]|uniref:Glutamine amidotransferase domain-containing protein n=1 Tax=Synchytrium endobioticum TaxID=286115 RepID=A0A507CL75_9FUNG|nr:hypothetical protein SeLEV6574_g07636 [Synchytrium endobioticum]TPX52949.1 hypothetical protein SeMB42_g01101 [Synchytrium endobioticum]